MANVYEWACQAHNYYWPNKTVARFFRFVIIAGDMNGMRMARARARAVMHTAELYTS